LLPDIIPRISVEIPLTFSFSFRPGAVIRILIL
jgi:hypothetical protein